MRSWSAGPRMLEGALEAHQPSDQGVVSPVRRVGIILGKQGIQVVFREAFAWRQLRNRHARVAQPLGTNDNEQPFLRAEAVAEIRETGAYQVASG